MLNQKTRLKVSPITDNEFPIFRKDIQKAFQNGIFTREEDEKSEDIILPFEDIDNGYARKSVITYKATVNNEIIGGAMVSFDKKEEKGILELLYVKVEAQGNGYGVELWQKIENLHPEVSIWETFVLYTEHRNLHFYLNLCGFSAVEFFNEHHKNNTENSESFNDLLKLRKYVNKT